MKKIVLAVALAFSFTGAAYACDCQKNQAQKAQCTCGAGQSCPGECNHAADAPPQKTEKKKDNKKS